MRSATAASKRSSTVSATSSVRTQRRRHRDAVRCGVVPHPVSQPPGRQEPRRNRPRCGRRGGATGSAASAGDGPDPVANAVVAPAHWVPAISFARDLRVRALAAGCVEPMATTSTPSCGSSVLTPSSASRSMQHRYQPVVFAEHVGLPHVRHRSRRSVGGCRCGRGRRRPAGAEYDRRIPA